MPKYQLSQKGDPSSEGIPTTFTQFLTKMRQYTEIDTNSDDPDSDTVRSILVQPTEPTGASANDLWVKIHGISGRPLGLQAYDGSSWRILNQTQSGDTASRPTDADAGEQYYDTDINVMLMYTGSAWVTQDGSPGDMKFVYIDSATYTDFATGKARAETLNPGWEYASDAAGDVLVNTDSSDSADYQTAGNTFGSKEHELTVAELAQHSHTANNYATGGTEDAKWAYADRGTGAQTASPDAYNTTNETGSGDGHENRQPSYTAFLMRKLGY